MLIIHSETDLFSRVSPSTSCPPFFNPFTQYSFYENVTFVHYLTLSSYLYRRLPLAHFFPILSFKMVFNKSIVSFDVVEIFLLSISISWIKKASSVTSPAASGIFIPNMPLKMMNIGIHFVNNATLNHAYYVLHSHICSYYKCTLQTELYRQKQNYIDKLILEGWV